MLGVPHLGDVARRTARQDGRVVSQQNQRRDGRENALEHHGHEDPDVEREAEDLDHHIEVGRVAVIAPPEPPEDLRRRGRRKKDRAKKDKKMKKMVVKKRRRKKNK